MTRGETESAIGGQRSEIAESRENSCPATIFDAQGHDVRVVTATEFGRH